MHNNYLKKIAKMLEIDINIPFVISAGGGKNHILKLTYEDLYILIDNTWQIAYGLIWNNLLNGKYIITDYRYKGDYLK